MLNGGLLLQLQAMKTSREPLINSSYRRRPVSKKLKTLDPGMRRDDGKEINQRFPGKEIDITRDLPYISAASPVVYSFMVF